MDSHPSAPSLRGRAEALRPTWDSAGSVNVPAWPCTGWGLPSRRVTTPPVRSYRTISPLPATELCSGPPLRRFVSVALSRGFPRVRFPDHPALRCPDFPRTPVFSPAPAAAWPAPPSLEPPAAPEQRPRTSPRARVKTCTGCPRWPLGSDLARCRRSARSSLALPDPLDAAQRPRGRAAIGAGIAVIDAAYAALGAAGLHRSFRSTRCASRLA